MSMTAGPYVHTFTLNPEWAARLDELQEAWEEAGVGEDPTELYFGVVHVANWRWERVP